jgi:hypothetical protein
MRLRGLGAGGQRKQQEQRQLWTRHTQDTVHDMTFALSRAAGALRAHQEGRRGAGGARHIQGEGKSCSLLLAVALTPAAPDCQTTGHGTWCGSRLL